MIFWTPGANVGRMLPVLDTRILCSRCRHAGERDGAASFAQGFQQARVVKSTDVASALVGVFPSP